MSDLSEVLEGALALTENSGQNVPAGDLTPFTFIQPQSLKPAGFEHSLRCKAVRPSLQWFSRRCQPTFKWLNNGRFPAITLRVGSGNHPPAFRRPATEHEFRTDCLNSSRPRARTDRNP